MRNASLSAVIVAFVIGQPLAAREWLDNTGKHKTEADFVAYADDIVQLRKKDGTIAKVPFNRLSAADQQHVLELTGAAPPNSAKPAGSSPVKWVSTIQTTDLPFALDRGMSGDGLGAILKHFEKDAAGKPIEASMLAFTWLADEKHSAGCFLQIDGEEGLAMARGVEKKTPVAGKPMIDWEVALSTNSIVLANRMGMSKPALDAALKEAERLKAERNSQGELLITRFVITLTQPKIVELICSLDGVELIASGTEPAKK